MRLKGSKDCLSLSRKGLKLSVTEPQSDKCESLMSASTALCIYIGKKGYTPEAEIYAILKDYYTATLSSAINFFKNREIMSIIYGCKFPLKSTNQ